MDFPEPISVDGGLSKDLASEIASGSKPSIDATKKIPGEGFKRAWPPLIKMDETVKAKVDALFGGKL
jgi:4-hydroxy-3-polyprenylbenzoate decarboxylase